MKPPALLCIDLQHLCAAEGEGMYGPDKEVEAGVREYFFPRLAEVVLPNVSRLQEGFRGAGREVLHCRIRSLTADGRDRSEGHKRYGLHAAPGSREAEFLPEVAPAGDEIVIDKTACGVFASTNLAYVLRNLGITSLVLCGVLTNECVESAAREGCDLGFGITVVEDACAATASSAHDASIACLDETYARIRDTDAVLADLGG